MYEGVCWYTGWSRTDLGPQTAFRRTFIINKKEKLTVRRHCLIVYRCCEVYRASKAPVKVVLYTRDGASLLHPQRVCDAVSAWQSVWIVLNVDINQATVLDSCHPGSPSSGVKSPSVITEGEGYSALGVRIPEHHAVRDWCFGRCPCQKIS